MHQHITLATQSSVYAVRQTSAPAHHARDTVERLSQQTSAPAHHARDTVERLSQQTSAPAHHARDTVERLRRETAMQFISPDIRPANSPDLNPADYRIWGMTQQRWYRVPVRDTDELRQRLVETWTEFQQSMVDWMMRLINGEKDWKHVSIQKVVTVNT